MLGSSHREGMCHVQGNGEAGDARDGVCHERDAGAEVAACVCDCGGEEQAGVSPGEGYDMDGDTATAVGSYVATATLASTTNYQWADGTTEAKSIPWGIAKADGPAAPTGLSGVAPTSAGGADGKIAGVTDAMEWSADGESWAPCSGTKVAGVPKRIPRRA